MSSRVLSCLSLIFSLLSKSINLCQDIIIIPSHCWLCLFYTVITITILKVTLQEPQFKVLSHQSVTLLIYTKLLSLLFQATVGYVFSILLL